MLAAGYFAVAAVCSLFGVIHSPMPGSPLVNPIALPGNLPENAAGQTPLYMAAGYGCVCLVLLGWNHVNHWLGVPATPIEEEENE